MFLYQGWGSRWCHNTSTLESWLIQHSMSRLRLKKYVIGSNSVCQMLGSPSWSCEASLMNTHSTGYGSLTHLLLNDMVTCQYNNIKTTGVIVQTNTQNTGQQIRLFTSLPSECSSSQSLLPVKAAAQRNSILQSESRVQSIELWTWWGTRPTVCVQRVLFIGLFYCSVFSLVGLSIPVMSVACFYLIVFPCLKWNVFLSRDYRWGIALALLQEC